MGTDTPTWQRLHDATLVSIALDWSSGEARLVLRLSENPPRTAQLVAIQVFSMHCPRAQPWGASVSVNGVQHVIDTTTKRERLAIEMQSGDTIALEAMRVHLEFDPINR